MPSEYVYIDPSNIGTNLVQLANQMFQQNYPNATIHSTTQRPISKGTGQLVFEVEYTNDVDPNPRIGATYTASVVLVDPFFGIIVSCCTFSGYIPASDAWALTTSSATHLATGRVFRDADPISIVVNAITDDNNARAEYIFSSNK